jgi:anti-sigma B factor antagonist
MPTEMFQLIPEGAVNIIELALPEPLDSNYFGELNDALSKVFIDAGAKRWIIDLSQVSYMGSSALGLMVNLRQQIRQRGGHVVLCALSPRLLNIFHTCCLERLFTIVKTREEARRELKHAR